MRKESFTNGEVYHVFNQGVDKRNLFLEEHDVNRFLTTLKEFNTIEPIESLYLINRSNLRFSDQVAKKVERSQRPLVNFVAYCLNPNHFHFLIEQVEENGISNFIKRVCGGYSWYFNKKYARRGPLFQGPFKARRVDNNDYFLHASVYVNLNNEVHRIPKKFSHLVRSSWEEYTVPASGLCKKENILDQFNNSSEYVSFARETLPFIQERKEDLKDLLLEELFSDQVAKNI